jgi:putative DNA methylase
MAEHRKKLIEVALPLKKINEQSAREKSIRHGHPSTLHLWWARRPLAACRAVLFAQLVDDPSSDPAYRRIDGSVDEERAGLKRAELFNLIEEMVCWENTNNPAVINKARAEIARCVASRKIELGELQKDTIVFGPDEGKIHPDGPLPNDGRFTAWQVNCRSVSPKAVNHFLSEYAPPVLDPFAGGGSIPLEAQRLGLRAHASDLNPVAVLINKALIEIPPKFAGMPPVHPEAGSAEKRTESRKRGPRDGELFAREWKGAEGLAEDVRYYGQWMRDKAEKRIGYLYPKVMVTKEMAEDRPDLKPYVGQELTVIAWLWVRTVPSPNPAVGNAHVPLVRSFWLSKKRGKEAYVQPVIDRGRNEYNFSVKVGKPMEGFDPNHGTVIRTGARCLISDSPIPFDHAREAGKHGEMKARLMAIVCEGTRGRVYLPPEKLHVEAADCGLPDEYPISDIPEQALGFRVQLYGMNEHWKLFTPRQLTALTTFSDLVSEARDRVLQDETAAGTLPDDNRPLADGSLDPHAYADAVATYLAFGVSRASDYWSGNAIWEPGGQFVGHTFTKQALQMVWDFAESNPFSDGSGNWDKTCISWIIRVIENGMAGALGFAKQASAVSAETYKGEIISTDPPYYDNIGYADLSDYFYIWLRRSLQKFYPDLLNTMLTPKAEEMIASPYRHEGSRERAAAFFEKALGTSIGQWRRHGHTDYPTTIFYAFKQAETDTAGTASTGWETFLSGVINQDFCITGTWPLRTERSVRSVAIGTNALASSVVLACVPRAANAIMATRRDFLNQLKRELPDALRLLQSGNIAPVDLAQAAIGPGMAVFSRYAKVIEADGSQMRVRTALTLINQMLDEVLAEQEGEFDADTRWAVAWFEQYGVQEGPYGVAETLSRAKNTSVQGLAEAGIVKSRSGSVQLLDRGTLPAEWDPAEDNRLTAWEATQHLIRALDRDGESGAADLLHQLGGDFGDKARDLAYRLYSICERKGWAHEALAYNSIVLAWPEISKIALASPKASQQNLFK